MRRKEDTYDIIKKQRQRKKREEAEYICNIEGDTFTGKRAVAGHIGKHHNMPLKMALDTGIVTRVGEEPEPEDAGWRARSFSGEEEPEEPELEQEPTFDEDELVKRVSDRVSENVAEVLGSENKEKKWGSKGDKILLVMWAVTIAVLLMYVLQSWTIFPWVG